MLCFAQVNFNRPDSSKFNLLRCTCVTQLRGNLICNQIAFLSVHSFFTFEQMFEYEGFMPKHKVCRVVSSLEICVAVIHLRDCNPQQ